MILTVILIIAGVLLSAFFSGSETGFYRVTRVRLVMDAKSGNLIARCMLWMVGRPSVVVATVLIGNNVANYMVSLGLVLASDQLLAGFAGGFQTFLPVLATPLMFIYGELLPKYLFYHATYLLSSRGAPILLAFALLFFPISIIVIGLETLWQRLWNNEQARSKFSLERQELQRVLMEGQEVGLLLPVQREIAQNLFTYGVRPVRQFAVPMRAIPIVSEDVDVAEVLAEAKRHQQRLVGVLAADGKQLAGCYNIAELIVLGGHGEARLLPIYRAAATDSSVQVLTQLQSRQSPLAEIVDSHGTSIGVVSRERLTSLLLPDI